MRRRIIGERGVAKLGVIIAVSLGMIVVLGVWQLARLGVWPGGDHDGGGRPAGTSNDTMTVPPPPDNDYVGSQVCAECHAEISASYAAHPMGQSLHGILDAPVVENFEDTEFSPGMGLIYRVELTDQEVRHHEAAINRQGTELYDQGVPVDYAIGSGHRGRSYALDRDGWLFLSPIAWYSQEKHWGLSPGYDPQTHPRFERELTDRCLQCHAGRLNPVERSTADIQQYQRPAILELAIGCERCHGPGKAHVERWRNGDEGSRAGLKDSIVNPVNLEPARRESVCNQCHLQGAAQFLRYGRAHGDFRPGDHLGEIWTTFVAGSNVDLSGETVAVSQVEQMHASRCFQRSSGKLGCISCHDPHRLPNPEERLTYFRQRCINCHQEQGCSLPEPARQAEQDSCIACHMPRLSASDIPHTVQTDHRILRTPSQPESSGTEDAPLAIFDENSYVLPELERQRAEGLLLAKQIERSPDPDSLRELREKLVPIVDLAPDDLVSLDALALGVLLEGDRLAAIEYWQQILELDPRNQTALQSLALQYEALGEQARAAEYLKRLVEANPWRADWQFRHAFAEAQRGQLNRAIDAARKSIELDPSVPGRHFLLADLLQARGERDEAEAARELGRRLQRLSFSP